MGSLHKFGSQKIRWQYLHLIVSNYSLWLSKLEAVCFEKCDLDHQFQFGRLSLVLTERECLILHFLIDILHVSLSLLYQIEPQFLSFLQRDRKVYIFHDMIHNLIRQCRKPLAISDLRTPPILLLGWHIGSRDDAAMRVNQKERQ